MAQLCWLQNLLELNVNALACTCACSAAATGTDFQEGFYITYIAKKIYVSGHSTTVLVM